MTTTNRCPQCGAQLPRDAPVGLCPRCLMQKGMQSTAGYGTGSGELPQEGQQFGPYRLGRLLGKGGMGAVYEAEHCDSGRQVALKVLGHQLYSPEHRQRFLREGRLAASINHPNNVYIYGTEEINGLPVIAMELARGGTLADRVAREGPLPVGQAVDAILEIIAGLEAAHAAGVLHRDVKPSNCFVDAQGRVKIGDFGLSISTLPQTDVSLTQSGVFLGTPAFASPEQLRGDELDLRSDIYSVGVTLYYLLTGEVPFTGKQLVQLLATVLEREAPRVRQLREDVPKGLDRVVAKCLAKQGSHRFKSYQELREALLPYRSASPTPATLASRFLAFLVDGIALLLVAALLPLLWARDISVWDEHFTALLEGSPRAEQSLMLISLAGLLIQLAYYGLQEGIWGQSIGKRIFRLRVVRPDREPAGILRASVRSSIYITAWVSPFWLFYAVNPAVTITAIDNSDPVLLGIAFLFPWLLFLSARRSNGYAGSHELASGTRVVGIAAHESRPAVETLDEPLPDVDPQRRIGPYHVLKSLDETGPHPLLLGYDTRLLRRVWIRTCGADTPPVASTMRALARIGRLRWLNGDRNAQGGWDAYEAPTGQSLLSLIHTPQPWAAVRFWLMDLAQELKASRSDGTIPTALELDRVWITADGRAKLLDFRPPALTKASFDPKLPLDASTETASAVFLNRVAIAALTGQARSAKQMDQTELHDQLPLSARRWLNQLGSPEVSLDQVPFEALTRRPAAVSTGRRAGVLAGYWLVPLVMATYLMTLLYAEKQFLRKHPEVGELCGYVNFYHSLTERDAWQATVRRDVELVVADRFRDLIADDAVWSHSSMEGFLDSDDRQLLRTFVAAHPNPSPKLLQAAHARLRPSRPDILYLGWNVDQYPYSTSLPLAFLSALTFLLVVLAIIPSLACVLLLGDSLLLRLLDIAVVDRRGERASRLRLLCRWAIIWSLVLVVLGVLLATVYYGRPRLLSAFLLYCMVRMFLAPRSLPDRLAGTWLVPRS